MAWIAGKRGSYRVMWRTGGRGSSVKASCTFDGRAEAEEELRAIEADLASQADERGTPTSRSPLPSLLKRWADSRVAQGWARREYADEVTALLEALAKAREWGRVGDITSEAVDAWVIARGGTGIRRPMQYLKGFLRWARDQAGVRVDGKALAYKLGPRIPRPDPPLLTDMQVAAILARAATHGPQVVALVEHIALYGCRPVDACKVTVGDYVPQLSTITYRGTKNKRDITHPLHPAHARRLDALCLNEDGEPRPADAPLFLNAYRDGGWAINARGAAGQLTDWYQANIGSPLAKATKDAPAVLLKEQAGIYCLKDFACSRLIVAARGNAKQAMAISGHRTESAFRRYIGSNADGQRATLEALPLIEGPLAPPPSAG